MNPQLDVLLVDDEKICLDILKSNLNVFSYVNVVGEINNGEDVVGFLQKNRVDLIFLDIEMEGISGFEIAKHIQLTYPDIMIIFLTGHVNFALDGYEYQPVDFLIKPVNLLRLEQVLSRVKDLKYNYKEKKEAQIGVHVEGGLEIINVSDILYIEKVGRKIYIVCKNDEKFTSSDSLQKLEGIFAEYNFFRSHQSFLVPIDKIKSIHIDEFKRAYTLQLKDVKEILPLSRGKYSELKELLIRKGMKFY
ncbi:response regulator transcription factor [Clostridium sp. P21]|uniref:Stage 0 sporulation protein A homolog n=1 Tax=Clostridium muellerianum TaxID=2716538 RepID=A0A7Y0HNZ6_9CLOT|nr:LytTR family DNA-binding domain-containing protein [Clostridium muellerianum]NMM64499.1 response regulator transcription factor [Clostridium muellerianum]